MAHRLARAATWTVLGFVCGAGFWHAVGLRTILSEDTAAARESASAGPASPGARVALPTIFLIDPDRCTALALDRASSRTSVQPCPRHGLALRLEPSGPRRDAAVAAPVPEPAGDRAEWRLADRD